ncbi:uncharacterized protein ACMZJ9_010836 [Mantella aurantiaca]
MKKFLQLKKEHTASDFGVRIFKKEQGVAFIRTNMISSSTELFFNEEIESENENRRELRGAFSDTEDYLDHGLISSNRCASRTSSIDSWSEFIKPSFTQKLTFRSVLEGEPVVFRCKLVACPLPKVSWFHNNKPISRDLRKVIKTESEMHIHNCSLLIKSVEDRDSGSYRIFAINTEGSSESTASLLVALREEQNPKYIDFVRYSEKTHKSIDTLIQKKRESKLKVDLKCVGSPHDKRRETQIFQSKHPKKSIYKTISFEKIFSNDTCKKSHTRKVSESDKLLDKEIQAKLQKLRELKRARGSRSSICSSDICSDIDLESLQSETSSVSCHVEKEKYKFGTFSEVYKDITFDSKMVGGEKFLENTKQLKEFNKLSFQQKAEETSSLGALVPEKPEPCTSDVVQDFKEGNFHETVIKQHGKQKNEYEIECNKEQTFSIEADTCLTSVTDIREPKEIDYEEIELLEPIKVNKPIKSKVLQDCSEISFVCKLAQKFDKSEIKVHKPQSEIYTNIINDILQNENEADTSKVMLNIQTEITFPTTTENVTDKNVSESKEDKPKNVTELVEESIKMYEPVRAKIRQGPFETSLSYLSNVQEYYTLQKFNKMTGCSQSCFQESIRKCDKEKGFQYKDLQNQSSILEAMHSTNIESVQKANNHEELELTESVQLYEPVTSALLTESSDLNVEYKLQNKKPVNTKLHPSLSMTQERKHNLNQELHRKQLHLKEDDKSKLGEETLSEKTIIHFDLQKETEGNLGLIVVNEPVRSRILQGTSESKSLHSTAQKERQDKFKWSSNACKGDEISVIENDNKLVDENKVYVQLKNEKLSAAETSAIRSGEAKKDYMDLRMKEPVKMHKPITAELVPESVYINREVATKVLQKPSEASLTEIITQEIQGKRHLEFEAFQKEQHIHLTLSSLKEEKQAELSVASLINIDEVQKREKSGDQDTYCTSKILEELLQSDRIRSVAREKENNQQKIEPMERKQLLEKKEIQNFFPLDTKDGMVGDTPSTDQLHEKKDTDSESQLPISIQANQQCKLHESQKIDNETLVTHEKQEKIIQFQECNVVNREATVLGLSKKKNLVEEILHMDIKEKPEYVISPDFSFKPLILKDDGLQKQNEYPESLQVNEKILSEVQQEFEVKNVEYSSEEATQKYEEVLATQMTEEIYESSKSHENKTQYFASEIKDREYVNESIDQFSESFIGSSTFLVEKDVQLELQALKDIEIMAVSEIEPETRKDVDDESEKCVSEKSYPCPPMFSCDIDSQEAYEGDICTFTSFFTGYPRPTVSWYNNDKSIPRNDNFQIVTTDAKSTLTFSSVLTQHAGSITCVIFNQYGTDTTFGKLKVKLKEKEDRDAAESLIKCEVLISKHLTEDEEDELVSLFANAEHKRVLDGVDTFSLQIPKVTHDIPCKSDASLSLPVEIKVTAPTPVPDYEEEVTESFQPVTAPQKAVPQNNIQTIKHKFTFGFVTSDAPTAIQENVKHAVIIEEECPVLECIITDDNKPQITWHRSSSVELESTEDVTAADVVIEKVIDGRGEPSENSMDQLCTEYINAVNNIVGKIIPESVEEDSKDKICIEDIDAVDVMAKNNIAGIVEVEEFSMDKLCTEDVTAVDRVVDKMVAVNSEENVKDILYTDNATAVDGTDEKNIAGREDENIIDRLYTESVSVVDGMVVKVTAEFEKAEHETSLTECELPGCKKIMEQEVSCNKTANLDSMRYYVKEMENNVRESSTTNTAETAIVSDRTDIVVEKKYIFDTESENVSYGMDADKISKRTEKMKVNDITNIAEFNKMETIEVESCLMESVKNKPKANATVPTTEGVTLSLFNLTGDTTQNIAQYSEIEILKLKTNERVEIKLEVPRDGIIEQSPSEGTEKADIKRDLPVPPRRRHSLIRRKSSIDSLVNAKGLELGSCSSLESVGKIDNKNAFPVAPQRRRSFIKHKPGVDMDNKPVTTSVETMNINQSQSLVDKETDNISIKKAIPTPPPTPPRRKRSAVKPRLAEEKMVDLKKETMCIEMESNKKSESLKEQSPEKNNEFLGKCVKTNNVQNLNEIEDISYLGIFEGEELLSMDYLISISSDNAKWEDSTKILDRQEDQVNEAKENYYQLEDVSERRTETVRDLEEHVLPQSTIYPELEHFQSEVKKKRNIQDERITSLEVEEVTFDTVYEFYKNQSARAFSPESEMSIEACSVFSDEIVEIDQFFTPPSSAEQSYSPFNESFLTPASSPDHYFTPVQHMFDARENESQEVSFCTPIPRYSETSGVQKVDADSIKNDVSENMKEIKMPPAFIKPLLKKRVFENSTLSFAAEVVGFPVAEVKWYRNSVLLEKDERAQIGQRGNVHTLEVNNIKMNDGGEYRCIATNSLGNAQSFTHVEILPQDGKSVALPPPVTHQHVMEFDMEHTISRSPSPQEILLEVELDESEVRDFEKQVKIVTLPEFSPDSKSMVISLDVLPLAYDDQNVATITKDSEDVKINFEVSEKPPCFIHPIEDINTVEGSNAEFKCSVTGIPLPAVKWFKEKQCIVPDSNRYIINLNGEEHSLAICEVNEADAGSYICKAENNFGEVSCHSVLTVLIPKESVSKEKQDKSEFIALKTIQDVAHKSDVIAEEKVSNEEEIEVEIEFESNGNDVTKTLELTANTDSTCVEGCETHLNINFDVFDKPSTERDIEFRAQDIDGCRFEFQVTESPPKFLTVPMDSVVLKGTQACFQCVVDGSPVPEVRWYKDETLVQDEKYILEDEEDGSHKLIIENASSDDEGQYKCIATNKEGTAESVALLKIR